MEAVTEKMRSRFENHPDSNTRPWTDEICERKSR